MSKLLEKKEIIHIATEIIVLFGITYYFSSKNKKLLEHIEDISRRLEEQEDLIQKHDKYIGQMMEKLDKPSFSKISSEGTGFVQRTSSHSEQGSIGAGSGGTNQKQFFQPQTQSLKQIQPQSILKQKNVSFNDCKKEIIEISTQPDQESDNESDLDKEIELELSELKQQKNNDDVE